LAGKDSESQVKKSKLVNSVAPQGHDLIRSLVSQAHRGDEVAAVSTDVLTGEAGEPSLYLRLSSCCWCSSCLSLISSAAALELLAQHQMLLQIGMHRQLLQLHTLFVIVYDIQCVLCTHD
jgi:hypothetical protein